MLVGKNVARSSMQYNFGPTHPHHFSYCDVIRPTKNTINVYKKVLGRRTVQSTFKDYIHFLQIYCFCVHNMFAFLIFLEMIRSFKLCPKNLFRTVFWVNIHVRWWWWWWYYPTPSEGWGRRGTPRRPNSRATPQGLDHRSRIEREEPKINL